MNASFLRLLAFMIATAVPSLALAADVAQRRRVEHELADRRDALEAVFGQALVGILELDPEARVLAANARAAEIVQRPEAELLQLRLYDLFEPGDAAAAEAAFDDMRRTGRGCVIEPRCRRPGGGTARLHCQVAPIRDAAGRLLRAVAVCEDVTARHDAEARQQLLLAELDHRVRNSFATILSMARLARPKAADKEAYAAALEARIGAMARTHGLLTRQRWEGAPLDRIVRDELNAYATGQAASIDGPDCLLPPRPALDIALVLHELATNAAKYGALSVPGGSIAVTWRIEPAEAGRRLVLLWAESGGPPVEPPTARGFGTRLIEGALAGHHGQVRLAFDPAGVRCRIELPLDDASRPPPEA